MVLNVFLEDTSTVYCLRPTVIPAKAGIQKKGGIIHELDSRLRGNDNKWYIARLLGKKYKVENL